MTSGVNALVIAAQTITADELDDSLGLLLFNHTPGARSFAGLDAAMVSAYGKDWAKSTIVILWFWVNP